MSDERCDRVSNTQRLKDAGILVDGVDFSAQDLEVIESLTLEEVDAIISIRDKLGSEFFERHLRMHLIF